jgi:hypothetical protein
MSDEKPHTSPIYPERLHVPFHEPAPINYGTLFAIMLMAVVIGNLLSTWIVAQYAQYVAVKAMQQLTKDTAQLLKKSAAQTQAAMERMTNEQRLREQQQQEKHRQDRAASPTGRKLGQQCEDWTKAFEQFRSDAALQEQRRHCGRYQGYIQTGQYSP